MIINNHDGYFLILSLRECLEISEVSASFSGESVCSTHDIRLALFLYSCSFFCMDNFLCRSLALVDVLCFLLVCSLS